MTGKGGWRKKLISCVLALSLVLGANVACAKVGKIYYSLADGLRVHPRPNSTSEYAKPVRLYKKNRVIHLSSKGGWWKVRILSNKYKRNITRVGYVDPTYLKLRK